MVALPGATPVTGTMTLVEFAGTFTDAGTVATFAPLELSSTVSPVAGAGFAIESVRFCVDAPLIKMLAGVKVRTAGKFALTWIDSVAEVKPGAEAVRLANPALRAVSRGLVAGLVSPAAMVTLAGETVKVDVSLLCNVTTTLEGAGSERVSDTGAD